MSLLTVYCWIISLD